MYVVKPRFKRGKRGERGTARRSTNGDPAVQIATGDAKPGVDNSMQPRRERMESASNARERKKWLQSETRNQKSQCGWCSCSWGESWTGSKVQEKGIKVGEREEELKVDRSTSSEACVSLSASGLVACHFRRNIQPSTPTTPTTPTLLLFLLHANDHFRLVLSLLDFP